MDIRQRLGMRLAEFSLRSRVHAAVVIAGVAVIAVAGSLLVRQLVGPGVGTTIGTGVLSCAFGYWVAYLILRGAAAIGRRDQAERRGL